MNSTIKLAIASALSLGAVAAHATIADNSTGASTMILFGEVLTSSNAVVASYAGDTGVSVSSAYAGTSAFIAADANLSALFAADVGTDTLVWAVEGGQYSGQNNTTQYVAGKTQNVTTAFNPAQIPTKNSAALVNQNTVLHQTLSTLNGNLGAGTSVEGPAVGAAGVWDANVPNGISGWQSGISSVLTGFQTVKLYNMTGTGTAGSKLAIVSNGTVQLSASGVTFATNAVPLPPAVWLLGSGLLGLAGVARRKTLKV